VPGPQFAPHLPAHPEEQHPAGEQEPDDLEELGRERREHDTQHCRGNDPDQDHPVALLRRKPGRRHADDDGVVAREHEVDHDDLQQHGQGIGRDEFTHARIHSLGGSTADGFVL
jgi:hypothetical protein